MRRCEKMCKAGKLKGLFKTIMNVNLKGREKKKKYTLESQSNQNEHHHHGHSNGPNKTKRISRKRNQTNSCNLSPTAEARKILHSSAMCFLAPNIQYIFRFKNFPYPLLPLSLFVACIISCLSAMYILIFHLVRLILLIFIELLSHFSEVLNRSLAQPDIYIKMKNTGIHEAQMGKQNQEKWKNKNT